MITGKDIQYEQRIKYLEDRVNFLKESNDELKKRNDDLIQSNKDFCKSYVQKRELCESLYNTISGMKEEVFNLLDVCSDEKDYDAVQKLVEKWQKRENEIQRIRSLRYSLNNTFLEEIGR